MEDSERKIIVAEDFSETPGGRYKKEGTSSGEEFREEHLKPFFKEFPASRLTIVLDGTYGYPTSFLEEAFGGLVRSLKKNVFSQIDFISEQEPGLIKEIEVYMNGALE